MTQNRAIGSIIGFLSLQPQPSFCVMSHLPGVVMPLASLVPFFHKP